MTRIVEVAELSGFHSFYTSGDVQRLVGISHRRLVYWDASHLAPPHARAADGRGTRRLYTALDVVRLKIIRRLLEAGMSLQKIRQAFKFVDDLPDEPAPLAELVILSDGEQIIVRRSNDALINVLTGQYLLRVPLIELVDEVKEGITPELMLDEQSRDRETLMIAARPDR